MSWMVILKKEFILPNNAKAWLKHLEHEGGAMSFASVLNTISKDPTYTAKNFYVFKKNVQSWNRGSDAAGHIVAKLKIKDRNIRLAIRNNYDKIHEKLLDFINIREQGHIKGGAKTQQSKGDSLKNNFETAALNIRDNINVDWDDLEQEFNDVYKRESKKNVNKFIETLGEKKKKLIYDNSPEDWSIKHHFETKMNLEEEAIREIEDYQVEQINLSKALQYIDKYCSFKTKSKKTPLDSRKRTSFKRMAIPEITPLQYTHGNLKKKHTDKLFISLLESHDANRLSHLKIWLENIKRKYSIRLDLLKESFLEQSWGAFDSGNDRFKGYIHSSFNSDPERTDEQNKKEYIEEVSNRINRSGTQENEEWLKWKNTMVKDIGETNNLPTQDFVNFIAEINDELKDGSVSRAVKALNDIYSEEEMKSYKNTMLLTEGAGFKQIKSAPHPLQSTVNVGYYNPPEADTTYATIVNEIYNDGVKNKNPKFKKLVREYKTYSIRNKTRESSLPDIEQLFTEGKDKSPIQDAADKFSNDLEKALAYTVYDLILSNDSVQDVIIKDLVKRYRSSDVNFIETIALLRKVEHNITKTNSLIPKIDTLKNSVDGYQNKEELKLKLRQGEQLFKGEIGDVARGMEDVVRVVKQKVKDLVKNKLLTIIRNQNLYQREVKADILKDLSDEGFIRRQST